MGFGSGKGSKGFSGSGGGTGGKGNGGSASGVGGSPKGSGGRKGAAETGTGRAGQARERTRTPAPRHQRPATAGAAEAGAAAEGPGGKGRAPRAEAASGTERVETPRAAAGKGWGGGRNWEKGAGGHKAGTGKGKSAGGGKGSGKDAAAGQGKGGQGGSKGAKELSSLVQHVAALSRDCALSKKGWTLILVSEEAAEAFDELDNKKDAKEVIPEWIADKLLRHFGGVPSMGPAVEALKEALAPERLISVQRQGHKTLKININRSFMGPMAVISGLVTEGIGPVLLGTEASYSLYIDGAPKVGKPFPGRIEHDNAVAENILSRALRTYASGWAMAGRLDALEQAAGKGGSTGAEVADGDGGTQVAANGGETPLANGIGGGGGGGVGIGGDSDEEARQARAQAAQDEEQALRDAEDSLVGLQLSGDEAAAGGNSSQGSRAKAALARAEALANGSKDKE